MRMRTWRDVHVVHHIFPKWIIVFSLTSHSTCAEWIIFMHVFCFPKLTQYQISMTEKNNFIWWWFKVNWQYIYIYILSFIIFICLKWFELITQSIKYLTVNHVLLILMYIHNIERTQNVKTKTPESARYKSQSRDNGEIVRWNGVISMVDVCLDARKGSGCQFLTRQGQNSHVLWDTRMFTCKCEPEFGQNTILHSIDTCIYKRHAISVTWEFGPWKERDWTTVVHTGK